MTLKDGREYRSLQDFSLVHREEGSEEYRVKGTAVVFDTPTVLFVCDGIEYTRSAMARGLISSR